MEKVDIKHKHHYVFQAYLRAWAQDERIWCCRKGKIFPTNTLNIAQMRDFYRLKPLNDSEIRLIKELMKKQSPEVQKGMMDEIMLTQRLFKTYDFSNHLLSFLIKISGGIENQPQEVVEAFNTANRLREKMINDPMEEFYTDIEGVGCEMIKAIKKDDLSFYYNPIESPLQSAFDTRHEFIFFICSQYFRTRAMKERWLKIQDDSYEKLYPDIRSEHIYPHIIWFLQSQCTDYLYEKQANLTLLINTGTIPFITSDQPVINLLADYSDLQKEVDSMQLYYPISPKRAVILNDSTLGQKIEISENEVDAYNRRIIAASMDSIFSNGFSILEHYSC